MKIRLIGRKSATCPGIGMFELDQARDVSDERGQSLLSQNSAGHKIWEVVTEKKGADK